MSPAFSSPKEASGFALLLLALLVLPALLGKSCLPPREEIYSYYSSATWEIGAFPYLAAQTFEEKGDIDIAFMGSSIMGTGIDTPYVEEKLSAILGRKAVVRTFWWSWNGYDPLYFIARDLLEHRKVHMIVTCDLLSGAPNTAHPQAPRWFRFAENADALAGLPLRSKLSFYGCAVLGMPRNLLSMIRANLAPTPAPNEVLVKGVPTKNPAFRLGSLALHMGFNKDYTFADFTPKTHADPSELRVLSENTMGTKDSFRFSSAPMTPIAPMQLAFAEKVARLARDHHTALVVLELPEYSERHATDIQARTFWPEMFQEKVILAGIPPARLFAGMTDGEIRQLFWDDMHFNLNGHGYFTPIVTPGLVQLYEDSIKP